VHLDIALNKGIGRTYDILTMLQRIIQLRKNCLI